MPNIDEAIEALLAYQQADMEGTMVLTSRQAIHEVADELRRLRAVAATPSMRSALEEIENIARRDHFTPNEMKIIGAAIRAVKLARLEVSSD